MNSFQYSDTNKRYHTQDYYLRHRFGCKVMKIPLNAGFSCPNIDGRKGTGGCAFCSAGSARFAGDPEKPLREQFDDVRRVMERKWQGKFIPYFQANSNTYAPTEKIRAMTEEALSFPDTVGIALSTRPDCVSDECADFFQSLSRKTFLTVELGLQTVHDDINAALNRLHTYDDFKDCVRRLSRRGINVVAHIINGLPGENRDMMLETAAELSGLPLFGVKIHLLHVLKNTALAQSYGRGEFETLSLEEYADVTVSQLRLLPPSFVIGRITGDGARDELIAPLWSLKKFCVMNEIDKLMAKSGFCQGDLYNG